MMKWYIDCIEDVSKQLQMLAEDKTRAKRPQRPGQKTEHTKTQETWLQHISYTERRKEMRAHGGRERQGQHAHKGGRERERDCGAGRISRRTKIQIQNIWKEAPRERMRERERSQGGEERTRRKHQGEREKEGDKKLGCSCVCVTTIKQRFSRGLILF